MIKAHEEISLLSVNNVGVVHMQKEGQEKFSKKFIVNKKLLPVKAHYLIYNAAVASVLPFRTVYGKTLGITGTETGVVFAVMPFIMVFTNPLCGAIVDHFKAFRIALYTLLFIVGVSHVSLTFIPQRESLNTTTSMNFTDFFSSNIQSGIEYFRSDVISPLTTNKNIGSCTISCDSIVELGVRNHSYSQCALFSKENLQKCGMITSEAEKVQEATVTFYDCNKLLDERIEFDLTQSVSAVFSINETFYFCLIASKADLQNSPAIEDSSTSTTKGRPFYSLQFWLFLFLIIVSNNSHSAVSFLMDTVCYELLEDNPQKYGKQRLWGTIGFGMGSLLAGYLNQLFSGDSGNVDYSPCFYLLGVLVLLDLIPLQFIRVDNVKYSRNIMKDVLLLIRHPPFLIHAATIYCVGFLSGLIWQYEMWFLEDLGATPTLLGLTQAVQCFLSELPCFFVAGWVCKKIGYSHCNSIALLCFSLRFLAYIRMENPWLGLPVGLLHGPTYGLFFAALTAYARKQALPGTEATVQASLQVVFDGLGAATGSILGGISVDRAGTRTTFMYAAILSFSMLVFNVFLSLILKPKPRENNRTVNSLEAEVITENSPIPTEEDFIKVHDNIIHRADGGESDANRTAAFGNNSDPEVNCRVKSSEVVSNVESEAPLGRLGHAMVVGARYRMTAE